MTRSATTVIQAWDNDLCSCGFPLPLEAFCAVDQGEDPPTVIWARSCPKCSAIHVEDIQFKKPAQTEVD